MRYSHIITMHGDDYNEAESIADEATAKAVGGTDDPHWPGLYRGCVEWISALLDHMRQWDYGEAVEDDVFDTARDESELKNWSACAGYQAEGDYLMTWDTSQQIASLYRRYEESD